MLLCDPLQHCSYLTVSPVKALANLTVAAMKKIDAGCGGQWMEVSQAESWKGRLFILCQAQDFRLSPGESVNGFPDAHH